ncbi:MAG: hypothetical protein KF831_10145 [Acidobacteria bacterium]|nr:hypothetical protein [Acidobacteriota bacterium]
MNRPTGIIRTLPNLYADRDRVAHSRMLKSLELLAADKIEAIYIALAQVPTKDVLHLYLLIEGKIICRMNIASYVDGSTSEVKCWDEVSRKPKVWAVCTAPLSFPPTPIARRGFQGFRYTEDLW